MYQLLKSLQGTVEGVDRMRIDQLLADVAEDVTDAASTIQKSSAKQFAEVEEEGEATVSAEVGSIEDLDIMDEDILRNEQTQATGFVGKISEVQWLRKLNHEIVSSSHGGSVTNRSYGLPGSDAKASASRADALKQRQIHDTVPQSHTSNFNFNLDDENVGVDLMIDSHELPPLETADRLVRRYMDSVHKSFPILAKKTFLDQFYQYYAALSQGAPCNLPYKWQALFNLVFAIGSVHSHFTEAEWRADYRNHFYYHSRALALTLKDPWWFSRADLLQTQIMGLLAVYYLAIGHTSRGWMVIGMAVRSALGLGLHVRNEGHTATLMKKEILARIWWGLHTLETLLSVITGRPSVDIGMHCSIYLPLPIPCDEIEEARIQALFGKRARPTAADELPILERSGATSSASSRGFDPTLTRHDPANSGTYLISKVKIVQISQKILTKIYSPTIIKGSWKYVQETIADIMEDLEGWASSLPSGLNVLAHGGGGENMAHERSNLTVYYHSTKILVSRPCLCRLDHRISNQSQRSNEFNQQIATVCVNAAKAITALLPDDMSSDQSRIYQIFPWWAAVHYIMQSLAVLTLSLSSEVSSEAPSVKERGDTVVPVKKLVRWLHAMSDNNRMARRAHSIILDLLQKMVVRIPIDVSDLVAEAHAESIPSEHTRPSSNFFAESYKPDGFLGHYTPDQQRYGSNASADEYQPDTYPIPDLFHQSSHSYEPLANSFLTEFDQYDPFPFGSWDVPRGDD